MVSVGTLRLVSGLYDRPDAAFEPRVEAGTVGYPSAASRLDARDRPTAGVLDALAGERILKKRYTTKSYVCPGCTGIDVKYIGACPRCGHTHTVGRTVARHADCGHAGPPDEFERADGSRRCPNCDAGSPDVEYDRTNVCQECRAEFADPDHRLQCRDCLNTYSTMRVSERTLYEYSLTDHGREWYETQIGARNRLVERLEGRGFETSVDATVGNVDDGHPVHVHAEEPLLDTRLVADVHDEPSPSDLDHLRAAADHADATGLVVLTTPSVPAETARSVEDRGLNLLGLRSDGTLTRKWTAGGQSARSSP